MAPPGIERGLDWPPSDQKSLDRGLMTRYGDIFSGVTNSTATVAKTNPITTALLMCCLLIGAAMSAKGISCGETDGDTLGKAVEVD